MNLTSKKFHTTNQCLEDGYNMINNRLLTYRGVPKDIVKFTFKLRKNNISRVVYDKGNSSKVVDSRKQEKIFKHTLKYPIEKNYIYCISSTLNAKKAQQSAFEIFKNATEESITGKLPYWHYIMGGYFDKIRDERKATPSIGHPSLIVFDGLYENCSNQKIEKLRDLLYMYSDIPRIIITCGNLNPLEFCYNILLHNVNRVLYLGNEKPVKLKSKETNSKVISL